MSSANSEIRTEKEIKGIQIGKEEIIYFLKLGKHAQLCTSQKNKQTKKKHYCQTSVLLLAAVTIFKFTFTF